jgi:hypothetical protein
MTLVVPAVGASGIGPETPGPVDARTVEEASGDDSTGAS